MAKTFDDILAFTDKTFESIEPTRDFENIATSTEPKPFSGGFAGMTFPYSPEEEKQRRQGLGQDISRLGKQIYNVAIAQPAQTFGVESNIGKIKTDINASNILEDTFKKRVEDGIPVTEEEIKSYIRFGSSEWKNKLKEDYQAGKIKIKPYNKEEAISELQSAMIAGKAKTISDADISATVEEASGFTDKAIDTIAGVTGFVTQLAVLRKAFPNAPQALIWELQNQATGGTPGAGAVMCGVFSIPGKIIPGTSYLAKAGRVGAESGLLASLNAAEQAINTGRVNLTDVAISAAIPVGLRVPGFVKAGLRLRNPKVTSAIERYSGVKLTEPVEQRLGIQQVVARRKLPELPKGKEQLRLPVGTQKALPEGLRRGVVGPTGRLQLPMTKAEAIDIRAREIYERLLQLGEVSKGYKNLNNFVQGQKFPKLDDLYKRINEGDTAAAEMIQNGIYASSPESYIEGLRFEAAKELGLEYKVGDLKTRFDFLEGKDYNRVKEIEAVPRNPQIVPETQKNVFICDNGKVIFNESKLSTRKVRGKEFPFAYENELFDTKTKSAAHLKPELTRGLYETESEYLNRVYGPQKQTVVREIFKEKPVKPNEPEAVLEFGDEYIPPQTKILPEGKGTMTEVTEPTKPEKPLPSKPVTKKVKIEPEIKPSVSTLDTQFDAIKEKLLAWSSVTKGKPLKEQEAAKHKFRSKQAGLGTKILNKALGRKTEAESIRASKGGYKGQMERLEVEPPDFTKEEWNVFSKKILDIYPSDNPSVQFKRTNLQEILDKIQGGGIPTNPEFLRLQSLLGKQATKELYKNLASKRQYSLATIPYDVIQFFKWKFNWDVQTPRQARSVAAKHPSIYIKSTIDNIKAMISEGFADKKAQEIENSPEYKIYQDKINWVSDTGYSDRRLEYYGTGLSERLLHSKSKTLQKYGQAMQIAERGAAVGINSAFRRLASIAEKHLSIEKLKREKSGKSMSPNETETWRDNRAKTINTYLKILRSKDPNVQALQKVAGYILYSSSMTVSRPWSIKAIVANTGSRAYAGEILASNIASIFLLGAIPATIGWLLKQNDPTKEPEIDGGLNPADGSFGKVRVKQEHFDLSFGDAPTYRTVARLCVSAYLASKNYVTGKEQTTIMGKKVQPAGQVIKQYMTSRETAALGWLNTMITGKDWMGQPISRLESTVRAITPEALEAAFDAGIADGLWASIAAAIAAEASVGTATYPVSSYSVRNDFENIISKREYDKIWDDLRPMEQFTLKNKYQKEFDELDRKIAEERVSKGFDTSQIEKEEEKAGKYIRQRLSKDVQVKLAGTSLGLGRMQQDFYLNDERFQRYKDLVVAQLDKNMANIRVVGTRDVQKKIIDDMIKASKKIAFAQLQSEISKGL